MKNTPQRFKLVEDLDEIKAQAANDPVIRQRRSRLVWAIIGIVLLFMLLNAMGIIETGHFERDPETQMQTPAP